MEIKDRLIANQLDVYMLLVKIYNIDIGKDEVNLDTAEKEIINRKYRDLMTERKAIHL